MAQQYLFFGAAHHVCGNNLNYKSLLYVCQMSILSNTLCNKNVTLLI